MQTQKKQAHQAFGLEREPAHAMRACLDARTTNTTQAARSTKLQRGVPLLSSKPPSSTHTASAGQRCNNTSNNTTVRSAPHQRAMHAHALHVVVHTGKYAEKQQHYASGVWADGCARLLATLVK